MWDSCDPCHKDLCIRTAPPNVSIRRGLSLTFRKRSQSLSDVVVQPMIVRKQEAMRCAFIQKKLAAWNESVSPHPRGRRRHKHIGIAMYDERPHRKGLNIVPEIGLAAGSE